MAEQKQSRSSRGPRTGMVDLGQTFSNIGTNISNAAGALVQPAVVKKDNIIKASSVPEGMVIGSGIEETQGGEGSKAASANPSGEGVFTGPTSPSIGELKQREALGDGATQKDPTIGPPALGDVSPDITQFNANAQAFGSAQGTGANKTRYTQDASGQLYKLSEDGFVTSLGGGRAPGSGGSTAPVYDEKRENLEKFYTNLMKDAGAGSITGRTINTRMLEQGREGLEALRMGDIEIGKSNQTAEANAAKLGLDARKSQFDMQKDQATFGMNVADVNSKIQDRRNKTTTENTKWLSTQLSNVNTNNLELYSIARSLPGINDATKTALLGRVMKEVQDGKIKELPPEIKAELDQLNTEN